MQSIIQYLSMFSALVPILVYIMSKGRFESSKWLLYYLLLGQCFELVFLAVQQGFLKVDSRYFIHGFLVFEFCIISYYFFKQSILAYPYRHLISIGVLVAVIIYCGLLRTERFFNFNNVGAALFSLLVIIYCIMAFRKLAKRAVPIFLEKTALFWVVSGFLLFFSGSFFVFVFWNYSAQSTLYPTLWMVVHDGFNILKCIFIAISFTRKIEQ